MKRLAVVLAVVTGTIGFVHAAPAGAVVNSSVGAGYVQSPDVGVSVAYTDFRVPSITCANNNDIEELRLGAVGFTGAAASGNHDIDAQVVALCFAGSITYTATVSAPGVAPQTATVMPGWVIDAYFRESSTGSVATVTRLKPSVTQLANVVGNGASDQSVLIGQQEISPNTAVPTFTDVRTGMHKIPFSASYVNGYEMQYDGYATEQLRQVNNFIPVIAASALNTNNRFLLVFKHN